MKKFKGLMTSLSPHWSTPKWLYEKLNQEFVFNDDPCPLHSEQDGLLRSWGSSTFVNPQIAGALPQVIKIEKELF